MPTLVGRMKGLSRWWWLAIVTSVVMWLIAIVPSGLGIFALVVFTAPAAAIGVLLRWASCILAPWRWNWRTTTNAALASAMLLPPLLAALVTIAGLQRPEDLLTLFVLGAWIALAIGLLVAVFISPPEDEVPRRPLGAKHRRSRQRPTTHDRAPITDRSEQRGTHGRNREHAR